jgi:GxxExxY protein
MTQRAEEMPDPLTGQIVACAMKVHSSLGAGLLEGVYAICLARELSKSDFKAERQLPLPVRYDGETLDAGYRIDLLVERAIIVEVKSVEKLMPLHTAQLLTYLRLAGLETGLLINFNVAHLRDWVKRVSNSHVASILFSSVFLCVLCG